MPIFFSESHCAYIFSLAGAYFFRHCLSFFDITNAYFFRRLFCLYFFNQCLASVSFVGTSFGSSRPPSSSPGPAMELEHAAGGY